MRKRIDRETALEYIYEFGWSESAKIFGITEEILENIVEERTADWKKPHINVNATIDYINPKIAEYIDKHYSEWYNKFVKNKDKSIFYQNDEDVFHTSLIKLCSELSNPSESLIESMFEKIFNDSKYRYNQNSKQMKKKEINTIELIDNDDNENE